MVNDPVSNLIVKLKNASMAKKGHISSPYTKFLGLVLDVLKNEGYIKSFDVKGSTIKTVNVELCYEEDGNPKIGGVERVSKFSKRVYEGVKGIKPVKNKFGMLVLSTSKGVMGDKEAKKKGVGGEALFKIW